MDIKKNSVISVKINNLAYGGRGIGRYEGIVVFVPGTIPGDIVQAKVLKIKRNFIEATLEDLTVPSPYRIKPRCPLFGKCGGCAWQNLPYDKQLVFKEEIAKSVLEHLGKQDDFKMHSIIASPDKWRYRNKVDYTFGSNTEGNLVLGFHKRGSYFEILDVLECFIQPVIFDGLIDEMRQFARSMKIAPYNPKTHEGNLRHFMLRCAENPSEGEASPVIAVLVTAESHLPHRSQLLAQLRNRCPSLRGFLHVQNRGLGDVIKMEKVLYQWGDKYIVEHLENFQLRVSAFSFFQTNTKGAELLYAKTREFLSLTGKETLLDAYCGTGSIGIFCSRKAAQVSGIEIIKEATWDARINAAQNSLDNCLFLCGEMKKRLPLLLKQYPFGFQRVVVDPPRSGLDKKSLRQILELNAPVLVYVSCNPTTFARDAKIICDAGYYISDVQPVDMFPQTYHIETVTKFVKQIQTMSSKTEVRTRLY
jgi:23S rRNA (uracil1939-C5)-methyltransferase